MTAKTRSRPKRADTLIRTKLYAPQVQPTWVSRPRLVARLNEVARCSLTLVAAPAGFGKTTLLGEWVAAARSESQPVAWLTLDERDNDPARFSRYLITALAGLGLPVDEKIIVDRDGAPRTLEAWFTQIINQLTGVEDDFVLALDDYHLIRARAIHQGLLFLLDHLPPQMHVILASRTDPPLPLGQLRARGHLLELRAADLRFTTAEMRAFLRQKMGLDLPTGAVAALEARTEGWIAAVQLAAIAMQDRQDLPYFVQSFDGDHRYVVDYLAEQVLQQQPESVRSFLLKTSILERLTGPLCDALTGQADGRDTLERLEKANLFLVPLDDNRQWYRYHHLFTRFLRDRLKQSDPGRWPVLQRQAMAWYEDNGYLAEAVDHALTVGDAEQALPLVEQVAEEIWMKGEMVRLLGWLEALPDELLRARPRLCIFHAWIANIMGEFERRDQRLCDAEKCLSCPDDGQFDRDLLQGMLAATHGIVAIMAGDATRTLELCQRALADLPEDNLVWRCVVKRNLGNAYLLEDKTQAAHLAFTEAVADSRRAGNTYVALISMYELAELQIVLGHLHHAEHTCRTALQLAAERGAPGITIVGALHLGLCEVLRERNRLDEAREHALAGIEYGLRDRSIGVRVCGYTRLGSIEAARGDYQAADEAYLKAMQLAPRLVRTAFISHQDAQARLWSRQGDRKAAARWVQQAGLQPSSEITLLNEAGYLTLTRLLLAEGQLDEAHSLLEHLEEAARTAGRTGRVIESRLLRTRLYHMRGETAQAENLLVQALVLAEPEGYLRIFLDEGEVIRQLVLQIRQTAPPGPVRVYLDRLLESFGVEAEAIPALHAEGLFRGQLVDPLSEREMDVLRLIAAGLTNQEVAEELVVATSTVHWHTKNIYRKLDVSSRTQASLRARELGILAA